MKILKDLVSFFREIDKASSFDRFHHNDRLAVLFTDFVDLAAFHGRIFIIHVIELDLDDLDLRMLRQNHVQDVRLVMEGDSEMANQPFLLQRITGLISPAALVFLIVVPVLGVHQVEVKIVNTAQLKLPFDKRTDVFLLIEVGCRQLVGQKEFLSGIALCHTVPDCSFRKPADISVCRIEIVETGSDKGIRHPAELLIVHTAAHHGQAHAPKAEVSVYFGKESTGFHFCSPIRIYRFPFLFFYQYVLVSICTRDTPGDLPGATCLLQAAFLLQVPV